MSAAEYGLAHTATSVLNTPDFMGVFSPASGQKVKTDRCGQLRELEFIALPGTVFTIRKKIAAGYGEIYQVDTVEYEAPPETGLYVNADSLTVLPEAPPSRRLALPSRSAVVSTLRESVGNPYVWGGNVPDGVPGLKTLLNADVTGDKTEYRILAGLDCSGLLYHATNGSTPRNSSQLVTYGQEVAVVGKRPEQIAAMLRPLDLIVWNGHVIIVLDQHQAIESRLECGEPGNGGVVVSELRQRLAEIMKTRRPYNTWPVGKNRQDIFVIRRWYPS